LQIQVEIGQSIITYLFFKLNLKLHNDGLVQVELPPFVWFSILVYTYRCVFIFTMYTDR